MVPSENLQNQARLAPVIAVQNISRLLGNTLRSHIQPSIRKAVHQHSTRSGKRGGNGIHRRAAPRWIRPPGGQRRTRSAERGGNAIHRRAAPRWISPPGGQRRTRSAERGGNSLERGGHTMSFSAAHWSSVGGLYWAGVVGEQLGEQAQLFPADAGGLFENQPQHPLGAGWCGQGAEELVVALLFG